MVIVDKFLSVGHIGQSSYQVLCMARMRCALRRDNYIDDDSLGFKGLRRRLSISRCQHRLKVMHMYRNARNKALFSIRNEVMYFDELY